MWSAHILSTILAVSAIVPNIFSEKVTSVFRILPKTNEQLKVLYGIGRDLEGISFWKDPSSVNKTADVMVPGEQFEKFTAIMKSNKLAYDVTIPDVQELLNNASEPVKRTRSEHVYAGGHFGWTQFHTLDEIYGWLDSLIGRYPRNVKPIEAGRSYEGRVIRGVQLKFAEGRPGVFVEAGIHAREWISHSTATYLVNELLTSRDRQTRQLAQSYEWYIFPCVNPDGYAYTHVNPRDAKYRLWRKTRTPAVGKQCWDAWNPNNCIERTCYGADPNRNWGFNWGGPGSSHDPCDEIYSGKSAFSEPEVRGLAKYISSVADKLFAYISFHSCIEQLLFPYGHTSAHLDNYDEQYEVGRQAVYGLAGKHGKYYKFGNIGETLGPASGGSIDWVKSTFKIPFVYVYELRGHTNSGRAYGFVPPASEIIPNGEEVTASLVALFKAAAKYNYPQLRPRR